MRHKGSKSSNLTSVLHINRNSRYFHFQGFSGQVYDITIFTVANGKICMIFPPVSVNQAQGLSPQQPLNQFSPSQPQQQQQQQQLKQQQQQQKYQQQPQQLQQQQQQQQQQFPQQNPTVGQSFGGVGPRQQPISNQPISNQASAQMMQGGPQQQVSWAQF